jgi:hypothetical protein
MALLSKIGLDRLLCLKELGIVLPNVMLPVVEDSCLSPMMDRAIVRGFGYGGSSISPRARCSTRMAVVADRRRIPDELSCLALPQKKCLRRHPCL